MTTSRGPMDGRVWRLFVATSPRALAAIVAAAGVLCFFGFDLAALTPRLVLPQQAQLSFMSPAGPMTRQITVAVALAIVPLFAWAVAALRGFRRDRPVAVAEAARLLGVVIAGALAGAAIWTYVARHLFDDYLSSGITPMIGADSFVEWRWALGGAFVVALVIGLRDYYKR